MSTSQSHEIVECDLVFDPAVQLYFQHPTRRVLIAGKDTLLAAGDFPGAPDPHGWAPGVPLMPEVDGGRAWETANFEKPSLDGKRTLRVGRLGEFWMPERSTRNLSDRYKYRTIEALVFAFGDIPIWTRTRQAAMRLAEHCDPVPRSPMAGSFWFPVFSAS
jgi:hypothetical protein